mmetsp:Transcript_15951/g.34672  ORF Transcript_15951/g.34672 Transcript_15951/m.34672 type:complete len:320 (-) Transcript_15951:47-1006(-)
MPRSDELLKLIAAKRANPYSPSKSVAHLRAESLAAATDLPLPEGTHVESLDAGGTPADWVVAPSSSPPSSSCGGVFLFIHGGGYYRGSKLASRPIAAWLSQETGRRVLSIDYRLAPEHPYPAAVEDTLNAYRWLLLRDHRPADIVVGGVSAGGGLALALLLRCQDEGVPLPALAILMSPWTDMTMSGASFETRAEADPSSISRSYLQKAAAQYLNLPIAEIESNATSIADKTNYKYASPLHHVVSGLPPLYIQVGDCECLLDDSVEFARKARAVEGGGNDVTLDVWPDLIHSWQMHPHRLPEAQAAIRKVGEYCKSRLS